MKAERIIRTVLDLIAIQAAEAHGIEEPRLVRPTDRLADLGLDDMDTGNVLIAIEEKLGISYGNSVLGSADMTVADIIGEVRAALRNERSPAHDSGTQFRDFPAAYEPETAA